MLSLSLLFPLLPAALACAPLDAVVASLDGLPPSYSDALTLAASACSFPDIEEATLFVPPASVGVDSASLPAFVSLPFIHPSGSNTRSSAVHFKCL